jgi:hypothetical protein
MASSRFLKTPKLQVVLQVTETTSPQTDGRSWEVHDVERNRGFRVRLTNASLREAPQGNRALGRPFTDDEIDGALGLAIERALVTPPEKVAGPVYDVTVVGQDLYDSIGLGPKRAS